MPGEDQMSQNIIQLYRKRARYYDFTANLYYLIGFREWAFRKRAVKALALKPGDTVVEIGCGTGLNFSLLQKSVGPGGKIIGVDLTDAMLAQAQQRVEENGWQNVELVQSDAAEFEFPKEVNGVISSFAITLVPAYEQVIRSAAQNIKTGGRIAILDIKKPGLPLWLIKLGVLITKPFGVALDLTDRHPWEAVEKFFDPVLFDQYYFGFVYLSVGEAR